MSRLHGSCLCGAVRYQVDEQFMYAGYCHCSQCRKFSGSASSAFAGMKAERLRLTAGADLISTYEQNTDSVLCFCGCCGSSLFSRKPVSGLVHLRLGTLDDAPPMVPQGHVYVGSCAPWEAIGEDGLPRFETTPLVR